MGRLSEIVAEVREIWVNVANDAYQVFEWQKPQYGNPERYRVRVSRKNDELMSREVNATEEKVLLKVRHIQFAWTTVADAFSTGTRLLSDYHGDRLAGRNTVRSGSIRRYLRW